MHVYSDDAQMTSKHGKNKEVRYHLRQVVWLKFLPCFDK